MLHLKSCSQEHFKNQLEHLRWGFFAKILNDLQPLTVFTKSSLVDVWLGSKYASGSLNTPCDMVALNNFILKYLCHHQFIFCFRKWKHYIEKRSVIKRPRDGTTSTTSEQTDTTGGQTSTTNEQTSTTSGQTSTASW